MNFLNKEIASTIICADLINQHLINGLNELGIDAQEYSTALPKAALLTLGYAKEERTDTIYNAYHELVSHYLTCGKPSLPMLKLAATAICEQLQEKKKNSEEDGHK